MDQFCSLVSRQSGEPLYGSAGVHAEPLYVSWDQARWHAKNVLLSEGVPESLRQAVAAELERGRKFSVRFFEDHQADAGTATVKLFPAGLERRGIVLENLGDAVTELFAGTGGRAIEGRELYICGDAAHDRCCGRFGVELLMAAREIIRERALPLRLYRSSHLGGHKFSPTGIVFPEGIVYGRIGLDQLPQVLDAAVAGMIHVPCFRGHAGDTVEEQIATYAAATLPEFAGEIFGVEDVAVSAAGEKRKRIVAAVRGNGGSLRKIDIEIEERDFVAADRCGDAAAKTVVRWVVFAVMIE